MGIGTTEILFVQCKHAQDGRTFDRAAIDEVVGGETYYTYNFFPSGLRGRVPRLSWLRQIARQISRLDATPNSEE